MRLERVYDPADPRVADYVGVTDGGLLRRRGLFMAEGRLVVRTLLGASPFRARSVLLTGAAMDAMADLVGGLPDAVPVYLAEQPVMDAIAGFHIHRGCLASGERGDPLRIADLLGRDAVGPPGPLIVLEDLSNHDNVGSVFRNALAFGARGIVLSPACCDPLYRKAIRVSMGAALRVPFARSPDWPGAIDQLRAEGYTVAALTPGPDARDIGEAAPGLAGERIALLLGAEGPGLSSAALDRADERLRIPMAPGVDSVNVATACGIALHRLARL